MAGLGVALACYALLGARAQSGPACLASGTCPSVAADFRDSSLLQRSHDLSVSFTRKPAKGSRLMQSSWFWRRKVTSDCASRLGVHYESPSACVVTRNNEALLVWVPYGSAPGWDLPGGMKKRGESACETAERETCEETGYKVRAVARLAYNIFKCEIVAANVCRTPVDEGFLRKTWAVKEDLDNLQYRGGTWGDKEGHLASALQSSEPQPDWTDSCGCKTCHGEGFSTTQQQCVVGKTTENNEACACAQQSAAAGEEPVDVCGCKVCAGEGWSSTAGRCASGSDTDPQEACDCQVRNGGGGLLQKSATPRHNNSALLAIKAARTTRKTKVTSNCGARLNAYGKSNAACIVVRDNRALMVWVPYGGQPGWDLPGGSRHHGELACETAEREVCEETGFQVRATRELTHMVFECEIVAANVCKNPVDEGFLNKKWAWSWELDFLQYRGYTWGDKVGLLKMELRHGSLLQSGQATVSSAGALARRSGVSVTSDCASRLNVHSEHHSACVVTRDNKALLVWVPYGSAPGWDLPGGMKHHGESACETAERETCEETGIQVRAVERLASNIFRCEVVAEHVCTSPVDEGFLRKQWARKEDLGALQYRGGTWGDKQGFLSSALQEGEPQPASQEGEPQPDQADTCGCNACNGEGFSSTRQQCAVGSITDVNEACACAQQDACGCRACAGEGWSSSRGRCARGSDTDPQEACACLRSNGAAGLLQAVA
uniref:Nudix hydrolase domain-containing protein n=1 Tax=Zooxanthella nutricula TaxID=1333877 RepID=A0A7S2NMK4_9DINO|mmetsp:Transcript_31003/g.93763  ORF Transcript_31003/g.93763 Transcript_31003/m.93763 type:complete len:720 (+) Transcript_31003:85-2244(+)